MGLLRRKAKPGVQRTGSSSDLEHLTTFLRSREGVEAYVEPQTTVTDTTVVLVAKDGEWTRRRVNGVKGAEEFAKKHGLPLYDAVRMGYPQRMREWTERNRGSR